MTTRTNTQAWKCALKTAEPRDVLRAMGQIALPHKSISILGKLCRDKRVATNATAIVAVPRTRFALEN